MSAGAPSGTVIHASCLVWGETGILVRGASGAGKSSLVRALLLVAAREGRFGRLVADDRVRLTVAGARAIAAPVSPLEGLLEIRGEGLVRVPHEPEAVVHLVVDLAEALPARFPEPSETRVALAEGVELPRITTRFVEAEGRVLWRLRGSRDTVVTER